MHSSSDSVKSNEKKSIFYLHPSFSNDPDMNNENKYNELSQNSRCKSYTNLNENDKQKKSSHTPGFLTGKFKNFFGKHKKNNYDNSISVQDNLMSHGNDNILSNLFINQQHDFLHVNKIESPILGDVDKDIMEEFKKKLPFLTDTDRIELQQKGLQLLKLEIDRLKRDNESLKKDSMDLKQDLEIKRQPIRSDNEIENLKKDIRILTNEKGELELKISQTSPWKCLKCTFLNPGEKIICEMCFTKRDFNEFVLCKFCTHRNSLTAISCSDCNAYLLEPTRPNDLGVIIQQSCNSTNNQLYSGSNLQSPLTGQRSPYSSPVIHSRLLSNRGLNGYTSQTSLSPNGSPAISAFDNPVYFNLDSNPNLNDTRLTGLPPRSPNINHHHLSNNDNDNSQPSVPVVFDDESKKKCKNNKKNRFF